MAREILDVLAELRAQKVPYAVATVVETTGSASAKTGSKAVVDGDGRIVADWVGGGCAESTTCQAGLDPGARTPEEIALCIISEIVMPRRGGSGLRLRDMVEPREARARAAG